MGGQYELGAIERGEGQPFRIQELLQHPQFEAPTFTNDIMLVKLDGQASAQMQSLNIFPNLPLAGAMMTSIGFGRTLADDETSRSQFLLKTTNPVLPNEDCEMYSNFDPNIMVCIETITTGTCQGDSGGPALDGGIQFGITSFSSSRGCVGDPSVATRVGAFDHFIQQGICDLSAVPPEDCPTEVEAALARIEKALFRIETKVDDLEVQIDEQTIELNMRLDEVESSLTKVVGLSTAINAAVTVLTNALAKGHSSRGKGKGSKSSKSSKSSSSRRKVRRHQRFLHSETLGTR